MFRQKERPVYIFCVYVFLLEENDGDEDEIEDGDEDTDEDEDEDGGDDEIYVNIRNLFIITFTPCTYNWINCNHIENWINFISLHYHYHPHHDTTFVDQQTPSMMNTWE